MKARAYKDGTVLIMFNGERERELFASLFNCSPICDALSKAAEKLGLETNISDFHEELDSAFNIHQHTRLLADSLLESDYIQGKLKTLTQ